MLFVPLFKIVKMQSTWYFKGWLVAGTLLLVLTAFVQRDDIIAALRSGSAERLARHFDQAVDITLPEKSNTFSKGQAELVLRDFFAQQKVRNFVVQHSGSNPTSNFIIGTLSTAGGDFRTTVFIRQRGDKQLIQGVEIQAR